MKLRGPQTSSVLLIHFSAHVRCVRVGLHKVIEQSLFEHSEVHGVNGIHTLMQTEFCT